MSSPSFCFALMLSWCLHTRAKRSIAAAILFGLVVCPGRLTAIEPNASSRIDFVNDLIPVFTKHGCNSGACHGSAAGRGGLRLSLYGGNPAEDYEAIVLQLQGRRVNLHAPDQSLIVLKPTESIAHGGGYLMEDDDPGLKLLTDWIAQGAYYSEQRELVRVAVTPNQHLADKVDEPIPVRVEAFYGDGSSRDVTAWTVLTPEDKSAVTVTTDNSQATLQIRRRGRHIVVARYLDQVVPIEVLLPLGETPLTLPKPGDNFIDREIAKMLAALGLPASPAADETTLRRRLALHLTGRLPGALNEDVLDASLTREELVDRLIESDAFLEYWTFQFAKLLRLRPQQGDTQGAETYHAWISQQLREGAAYDAIARALILAEGDSHQVGAANFYRSSRGPREQAEFFSELFMGSRLRCANCHNHPLDRWTQDDYHGLAAIFAKVDRGQVVKLRPRGEVIHPQTLEPAVPRIPGEEILADEVLDGRTVLADWLTQPENPYFAKAIVNRLWKHLMGRGLVEPVDDFRATNPATHPALLEQLANDFVAHGYDMRHTLRQITLSQAYARSSEVLPGNREDDRYYSHALMTALEPEVLADAITDVLGIPETYGDASPGTRAITLVSPLTPSTSLDILGRCSREDSCEDTSGRTSGLTQKLHLFNGPLLNQRLQNSAGRLSQALNSQLPPLEIIGEFYQVALSRAPREDELQSWQRELEAISNDGENQAAEQRLLLEDFVWALLTSKEFVTNH